MIITVEHYTIVAHFPTEETAREVEEELRGFLAEHARQAYLLNHSRVVTDIQKEFSRKYNLGWENSSIWWSESDDMSQDMPTLAVLEQTLVVFHRCSGGLAPLLKYLEARGAKAEGSSDYFPTVSGRLRLPEGAAGQKLFEELSNYFSESNLSTISMGVMFISPWGDFEDCVVASNVLLRENFLFFRDEELVLFYLIIGPGDVAALKNYLNERGVESYRLSFCAFEDKRKLEILRTPRVCPECGGPELHYHSAELENIDEDQMSCGACHGMFTLDALDASGSSIRVFDSDASSGHICDGEIRFIECMDGYLYILTDTGALFRNQYNGIFKLMSESKFRPGAFLCLPGERFLICDTQKKGVLASVDGVNWGAIQVGHVDRLAQGPKGLIIAGSWAELYCSMNGGRFWSRLKTGKDVPRILFMVSTKIFFGVKMLKGAGYLMRSDDGGKTWRKLNTGHVISRTGNSVFMFDEREGLFLDAEGIRITRDGGESWRIPEFEGGIAAAFMDVDRSELVFAITDGSYTPHVLMISEDRGETWRRTKELPFGNASSFRVAPDGIVYIGTKTGLLYRVWPREYS